jgi:hypothetical protein
LKNKGFKEESMTKVGLDAIGTSTTLEANKSLCLPGRLRAASNRAIALTTATGRHTLLLRYGSAMATALYVAPLEEREI